MLLRPYLADPKDLLAKSFIDDVKLTSNVLGNAIYNMHQQGIIHGQLHLGNIFIDPNNKRILLRDL